MPGILKSLFLNGPAGRLEALHEEPGGGRAVTRAAVFCHPHPLYGGTMRNKVVFRLARAARESGAAVLRFNFRGVGVSEGAYDEGRGEQDDCRAALAWMRSRYEGLPLLAGGFSFGSRIALRTCCGDPGIERVVAVGTAFNHGDWGFLRQCGCAKHFIQGTNDEHGSRENLQRHYRQAPGPKKLTWVETSDHFFSDALDDLEAAARAALA